MGCKIIGFENGPLEVDCEAVVWTKQGEVFEVQNPSYPCRCGHSKNKPFCDGSHKKLGFSSEREIKEEVIQVYDGIDISINFNRSICSGAEKCVKGLSSVFHSGSSTDWIFPNDDTNEKIISQISACPSGALSYTLNKKTITDSRLSPKIDIIKNGPYNVEGIRLEGFNIPTNFSSTKYALCRCGYSKNKPYCDYSHVDNNWKDES
ncbi:MAG TPA: hypothetical protein EYO73_01485 [Sulfurimonas sp.]|nr:hypothetical protein [Sulfurimonas sp.]